MSELDSLDEMAKLLFSDTAEYNRQYERHQNACRTKEDAEFAAALLKRYVPNSVDGSRTTYTHEGLKSLLFAVWSDGKND
jgi:hypothetical protein